MGHTKSRKKRLEIFIQLYGTQSRLRLSNLHQRYVRSFGNPTIQIPGSSFLPIRNSHITVYSESFFVMFEGAIDEQWDEGWLVLAFTFIVNIYIFMLDGARSGERNENLFRNIGVNTYPHRTD